MKDFFTPSVIAALTALVVSSITLYQFFRNLRFQQQMLEINNDRALTNKLYDLRLEHYPEAFNITDDIIKTKGNNYDLIKIQTAKTNLVSWKKGVVNIIISVECRDSYFVLRNALMKNPAENNLYSHNQVEKIYEANKNFRKQLRRDMGFMYREEKGRRKNK